MDPKQLTDALAAPAETTEPDKGRNPAPVVAHEPVIAYEKVVEPPSYDWLGPRLRQMYSDVLNEPIPQSFVELLKQLYDRQKRRAE